MNRIIPEHCNSLEEVRQGIDRIDEEIIRLIGERGRFVKKAATFKTNPDAVRDEKRVAAVIDSKKQLAVKNGVAPELAAEIYTAMIGYFIREEMEYCKADNS
ncbi:chorismate mutase [Niabella beijingensis]|uniref:chorismate mutase n=1 Tax=Niabella beijingensis TaxID=2872700 RepID=UPI001CC1111F|nr:chorismate mutase [Niabella beijingensis]MBZ4190179.1 chorismate mutase [Niabella beijingensis]